MHRPACRCPSQAACPNLREPLDTWASPCPLSYHIDGKHGASLGRHLLDLELDGRLPGRISAHHHDIADCVGNAIGSCLIARPVRRDKDHTRNDGIGAKAIAVGVGVLDLGHLDEIVLYADGLVDVVRNAVIRVVHRVENAHGCRAVVGIGTQAGDHRSDACIDDVLDGRLDCSLCLHCLHCLDAGILFHAVSPLVKKALFQFLQFLPQLLAVAIVKRMIVYLEDVPDRIDPSFGLDDAHIGDEKPPAWDADPVSIYLGIRPYAPSFLACCQVDRPWVGHLAALADPAR
nr:MAG TPA: hypothetical protein [Bacteriophage sp.]